MSKDASFSDVKVGFSQFSPIQNTKEEQKQSSIPLTAPPSFQRNHNNFKDAYDDSIIE
jgi:hypothetical protein